MKLVFGILIVSCAISVSLAAQAILLNATHPDHPGKCYDEGSKLVLSPQETKKIPGECTEISCSDKLSLTYTSCGASVVDDERCVEIEQDYTKDYPKCCLKYKCEVDGKISYH
ncbi:uncharacterized protein LOC129744816 [Uranotaenia lowii]|uniref:uncharacterized protein LOC129744816 n=1 Tax=Uranotaenia lowii TaxID=190385 RepID=UPI002479D3B2|nr:uncharacterized protein LOC129744816 [Uranotaenia lowii]